MGLGAFFRKLVGLTSTFIEAVSLGDGPKGGLALSARPTWRKQRCCECGGQVLRLHGQNPKERIWRHLGAFGHPVHIRCKVYRVFCVKCGHRTMLVPWARNGSVFTRVFEDEVAWFAQHTDKTATAEYFGISWVTVGNIVERVVSEKRDPALLKNLTAIGVDEICYGRPFKYLTVVVDLLTSRVVWSGEGQTAQTLGDFFDLIGETGRASISLVTMDMDNAYEKAVREWVPHAEIVYDRFHVVQLVNKALDTVRRDIVNGLAADPELRKSVKGIRWPLLKNPWLLTVEEQESLALLVRKNKKLYRAYLLKEAFQEILRGTDMGTVDEAFKKWYRWARRSRLDPFKRLAKTLNTKWDGIRRFLELRFTNALAEGFNSQIRLISHRAFGFHSAPALIAMIELCTSGIVIIPTTHG